MVQLPELVLARHLERQHQPLVLLDQKVEVLAMSAGFCSGAMWQCIPGRKLCSRDAIHHFHNADERRGWIARREFRLSLAVQFEDVTVNLLPIFDFFWFWLLCCCMNP